MAAAEAAAHGASSTVSGEDRGLPKPKPDVFDMVPESEGGIAPDSPSHPQGLPAGDAPAIGGPQAP